MRSESEANCQVACHASWQELVIKDANTHTHWHTHTRTCLCVFVCLASRLFVIRLKGIAGISLCGTRISPFLAKLHDKSRPKVVLLR